jgi:hypothetical protein
LIAHHLHLKIGVTLIPILTVKSKL